jgi:hypothetical protein
MAGDDGVQVWEAADDGVYADTTDPNHEYGVYTNDKIHAGEGVTSSGSWLIVAQSSDSRDLETGDVVAVSGMGTPLAGGRSPVPLVQATGQADSTAVVGVVYRRLVVEEEVEEVEHEGQVERRTQLHACSGEGPIAPGDHVLVAVMGPAQVKADPSQGEIHPGDLVTASTQQGQAMKAQPVEIGGAKVYTPGSIIGKAMEPLDASRGTGFIWVWVTLQ